MMQNDPMAPRANGFSTLSAQKISGKGSDSISRKGSEKEKQQLELLTRESCVAGQNKSRKIKTDPQENVKEKKAYLAQLERTKKMKRNKN
jgi:hypothetical protein